MINYIVVDKLPKSAEFHFSIPQHQFIFNAIMCAIEELNLFIFKESCKNNHAKKFFEHGKINTLRRNKSSLKNLFFKCNDVLSACTRKTHQKRKASNGIMKHFGNLKMNDEKELLSFTEGVGNCLQTYCTFFLMQVF